jgi:hypothetical protein
VGLVEYARSGEEAALGGLRASRKSSLKPSLSQEKYAGTYANDLFGEMTVALEGDSLVLHYGEGYTGSLEHWEKDTFITTWGDSTLDADFITFDVSGDAVLTMTIKNDPPLRKV